MVLWKGYDLRQNGIIVEKIPTITKGKKKIETVNMPVNIKDLIFSALKL